MRRVEQPELSSPLLDLFLELCALPSPSGHERAVADRVGAYLTKLDLAWDEDDAAGRSRGRHREHLLPASGDERRRDADLHLRAHGHGSPGGGDRPRRRRRHRAKRSRHDPRLGQQGRGRRHARGDAPHPRRRSPARGHRAPLHGSGGGLAARCRRLRPHAPRRADGLRLRPGRSDRRDRPRLAARAAARLPLPRDGRRTQG